MVVLSKLFTDPVLNQVPCGCFMHSRPNQSCIQAAFWNFYRNHLSSAKYYMPTVLILPLILSWRRMSKQRLRATFKNFLETTFFASTMNTFTFLFLCIFRRLHGHYHMLFTPFISCYLGAHVNCWAPPKVLQFFVTGMTHSAMEALMRKFDISLLRSRTAQTLIFMLSSMVVLRQYERRFYSAFWFIKPEKLPKDYEEWPLKERIKQALIELSTYVGAGVTMDVFTAFIHGRLRQLKLKSAYFYVSYMAIYKIVQIVLAGRLDMKQINLLAAFLSGATYAMFKHVPFSYMCYAVVIAIQALWQELCSLDATNNPRLATLQRIPWAKLLIPPSQAYVTHCILFHKHRLSSLAKAYTDDTCDNNLRRIHSLLNLPLEAIMTKINKITTTAFFF